MNSNAITGAHWLVLNLIGSFTTGVRHWHCQGQVAPRVTIMNTMPKISLICSMNLRHVFNEYTKSMRASRFLSRLQLQTHRTSTSPTMLLLHTQCATKRPPALALKSPAPRNALEWHRSDWWETHSIGFHVYTSCVWNRCEEAPLVDHYWVD